MIQTAVHQTPTTSSKKYTFRLHSLYNAKGQWNAPCQESKDTFLASPSKSEDKDSVFNHVVPDNVVQQQLVNKMHADQYKVVLQYTKCAVLEYSSGSLWTETQTSRNSIKQLKNVHKTLTSGSFALDSNLFACSPSFAQFSLLVQRCALFLLMVLSALETDIHVQRCACSRIGLHHENFGSGSTQLSRVLLACSRQATLIICFVVFEKKARKVGRGRTV